jgi:hypothetical protein
MILFRRSTLFLSLLLAGACATTTPDPRAALRRAINDPQADAYLFTTAEDGGLVKSSLVNPAVRDRIRLPEGDTSFNVGYTSIRDKGTNSTKIYRSDVVKSGRTVSLVVKDVSSGAVIDTIVFPELPPRGSGPPIFPSLEDCICKGVGPAQCEADRTCRPQVIGLICCTGGDVCLSVHILVVPKAWRCRLRDLLGDIGDLVFTQ